MTTWRIIDPAKDSPNTCVRISKVGSRVGGVRAPQILDHHALQLPRARGERCRVDGAPANDDDRGDARVRERLADNLRTKEAGSGDDELHHDGGCGGLAASAGAFLWYGAAGRAIARQNQMRRKCMYVRSRDEWPLSRCE
jgi:hypothetical protein